MNHQQVDRLLALLERLVTALERNQGVLPASVGIASVVTPFCAHDWGTGGSVCIKCGAPRPIGYGG